MSDRHDNDTEAVYWTELLVGHYCHYHTLPVLHHCVKCTIM